MKRAAFVGSSLDAATTGATLGVGLWVGVAIILVPVISKGSPAWILLGFQFPPALTGRFHRKGGLLGISNPDATGICVRCEASSQHGGDNASRVAHLSRGRPSRAPRDLGVASGTPTNNAQRGPILSRHGACHYYARRRLCSSKCAPCARGALRRVDRPTIRGMRRVSATGAAPYEHGQSPLGD